MGTLAIIQAIVTAASIVYQVKQAEKMKKKMEAAADARKGQKFTVSGSSAPLPVVYGKQRIGGIHCNYKVKSSYPSVSLNSNQQLETSFDNNAKTGSKNEFLAVQTALCHDGIKSVEHILVNEIDYRGYTKEMKENKSSFNHRFHIHTTGGTSDATATAFGFPSTNNFSGCAHVSNFFKLNRDEPQYSGIPSMAYIVKGRKVRAVARSGSSSNYTYSLSSSYTYSNNPALCLLDYLLNDNFGRGLTANDVDLESFYNAADICDTPVLTGATIGGEVNEVDPIFSYTSSADFPTTNIEPYMAGYLYYDETNDKLYNQVQSGTAPNLTANYGSGPHTNNIGTPITAPKTDTIPLYECNITLSTEETIRNNIERILNTMGLSDLVWTPQGKYKLILSYPQTQSQQDALITHTFDEDNIVRESVKLVFPKAQDRFNQVTVSFDNEFENFKDDTFTWPPTNSSVHQTYLTEDNNQPLTTSLQGDGVTSKYHAQALAEQQVRKSRYLYTITFSVNKEGLTVEPGDIIKINMPTMSISNEIFRVESIKVNSDFSVDISAFRFDFNILAWNVLNDLSYVVRPDFDFKVGVPTSLTFSNTSDITGTASGKLSWTAADDASVVEYIIEAQRVGTSWTNSGNYVIGDMVRYNNQNYVAKTNNSNSAPSASSSDWDIADFQTLGTSVTNSFDITGLKTGDYTFSVRSRNITGLKSERVELSNQSLTLITVSRVAIIYADSVTAASNSQSYTFSVDKPFVAYYVYNSDLPTLPITSGITFTRFIGINSKAISVGATSQTFTFNSQGTATPSNQSITLTAALQNTTATNATFTTSPSVQLTGTGNTRTLTSANFGTNDSVTITVTADSAVSDSITIYRLQDAVSGTSVNVQYSADDSTYTDAIPSGVKYIRYGTKADGATSFTYAAGVKYVPEEGIEYTVEDGDNAYLHIKYSNDNGTTFTGNSGEDVGTYIGTYSDNTAADSTTIGDYTWVQIEGSGGLTAILSNESHTLTAPNSGNPTIFTGSGTLISVFEGTTQLDYDATETTNGHFTVTAAATGCTAGAISDSTNNASVAALTAMTADTASVTFTITGKTLLGESFTITKTQSFSLSRLGDTGNVGESTDVIFIRNSSAPDTPAASSGVPTDWSSTIPTGTNFLWSSFGTRAAYSPSGNAGNYTWTAPARVEGESATEIVIYRLYNSSSTWTTTSAPTGGTYNFTTSALTAPTSWSQTAPAITANGDIVYRASGIASGAPNETSASITFSIPAIYAQRTDGVAGTPAKSVQITADSQVFTFDRNLDTSNNAIPVPSSQTITFTAKLQNTTASVTFTAEDESGNALSNVLTNASGNNIDLTVDNFKPYEKVKVTATADGISDSITIHKLREGGDAITVVLSNENHVLPCHPSGAGKVDGTSHYPDSGTLIQVYEGATALTAVGVFPGLSNGKFLLESRVNNSIQNNISYTSSGTAITIPDLKEIEARATSASVEYNIEIQTSTGVRVDKTVTQKFIKAIEDKVPQYSPIRFDHYKSGNVASYNGLYSTGTWGFDTSLGPSNNGQYSAFMGTGTVVWNEPASTVTSVGTNLGFTNSSGQSITDGYGDPVYQTNSLLLMLPSEEPNLNDYYHSITTLKVGNQIAVKKDGITVVFDVTYVKYSSFSYDARVAQYVSIIRVSYNSTQSSAGAETLNWPNLDDNNPLDIVLHHELKGNSGADGTIVSVNGSDIFLDPSDTTTDYTTNTDAVQAKLNRAFLKANYLPLPSISTPTSAEYDAASNADLLQAMLIIPKNSNVFNRFVLSKNTSITISGSSNTTYTITGGYRKSNDTRVFYNGEELSPNDFIAENGTTVALSDAFILNNVIASDDTVSIDTINFTIRKWQTRLTSSSWNTNFSYIKGDIVNYNDIAYIALEDLTSSSAAPSSSSTIWAVYNSNVWSDDAIVFDQPIISELIISREAIIQHLSSIKIDVDQLNINKLVGFSEGGGYKVNKNSPDDNENGIYLGNPLPSGQDDLEFAFATRGEKLINNVNRSHGVKFNKLDTIIENPVIRKGQTGSYTGSAQYDSNNSNFTIEENSTTFNSVTGTETISGVTWNYITIDPDAVEVSIQGQGGGGGGAAEQNQSHAAGADGGDTLYFLRAKTSSGNSGVYTDYQSIISTTTCEGGAGGSGPGPDTWRGDPGDPSLYAAGGYGGGSTSDGGDGSKGSGGGGRGGRKPDWDASSRRGGAGGAAGTNRSADSEGSGSVLRGNTGNANYSGGVIRLYYRIGNGGAGSGGGGDGGKGLIKYNVETAGTGDVVLTTESEYANQLAVGTNDHSVNFNSGMQMRFGRVTSSTDGNQTVTFSTPFSTGCLTVVTDVSCLTSSYSASSCVIDRSNNYDGTITISYVAYGY